MKTFLGCFGILFVWVFGGFYGCFFFAVRVTVLAQVAKGDCGVSTTGDSQKLFGQQ